MAHRWNVSMLAKRIVGFVAVFSFFTTAACDGKEIYSSPGFAGRVTDRETGQPIGNAIVVVQWGGAARSWATGMFICVHVAQTATDADGRYRVPAWKSQA